MSEIQKHKKICSQIFSHAGRRETEVIIFSSENALTRFADNAISQNVSNRSIEIIIRIMKDGKVSRAVINHTGTEEIKSAVENAVSMLKMQKPDLHLLPLPSPKKIKRIKNQFDKETANFSPLAKARKIKELVAICRKRHQLASGTLSNEWTWRTVANSKGVFATHKQTGADFDVTVKDGDAMGWSGQFDNKVSAINFKKVAQTASDKAHMAKKPIALKPGKYTVILEPNPVANMLMFAGIFGFGGQFFLEGQSFLKGKLGKKVFNENITIEDNGIDGKSASVPFDFEGMPRQKVTLIKNGIAKAVVHDRKTAKKTGTKSTGHALPQPNAYGPIPMNLVIKSGKSSLEKMIKTTKKGILVTQFHYVNILKPLTLDLTGLTRNGLYLIENGKIKYPIKNLRFTESLVNAFNNVDEISTEQIMVQAFFGGKFLAPSMKIRNFNFSSATEF